MSGRQAFHERGTTVSPTLALRNVRQQGLAAVIGGNIAGGMVIG